MPGFVLTNSQASGPLNTPQLMADHSFSCHSADTQIFLSKPDDKISQSSSASIEASERGPGRRAISILCEHDFWELGDCVWKKKHSGKVAAISV